MFSKKVLKTILTFLLVIACAAVSPAQTSQAAEKSYTDNDLNTWQRSSTVKPVISATQEK